jgi:hypothetical protein
MSNKYKKPDEPVTRQEACMILDHKRFDSAVRSGAIVPLGKMTADGAVVPAPEGAQTAPLAFDQQKVRDYAKVVAADLARTAREHREAAKDIAKRQPPLTRRQIATHLGKRQTGILIRSGAIEAQGALTDTQTAAHTYSPDDVARVIGELADAKLAESRELARASKTRIPA